MLHKANMANRYGAETLCPCTAIQLVYEQVILNLI